MKNYFEIPFLGREKELKILKEIFDSAFNYQGSCAVICGEPGIGKKRLLNAFLSSISLNIIYLNVHLTPHSSVKSVFIDVIKNYLNKTGRPAKEVVYVIGKEIYDEYADIIPDLKLYFPYEPQKAKPGLSEIDLCFAEFIERLSRFSPVIFVIEGMDNANKDIFYFLNSIINRIERLPVLIISILNNNNLLYNLQSKNVKTITLDNLSKDEVIRLNDLFFDKSLNDKFFDWLWQGTKGNPLFLKEYLTILIEKGVIYFNDKEKRWDILPNYDKIPLFEGIPEVLRLRFAGLTPKEIELLEIASIIGEELDLSLPFFQKTKGFLNNLLKRGIIKMENEKFRFSHPLIKEIIYSNIPEDKKIYIHKSVGEHFKKTGDKYNALIHFEKAKVNEIWMVEYLLNVVQEMGKIGDITRSELFLEKAYNIAQKIKKFPIKKFLDILYKYADVKTKIGIYSEAIESCERYLKLIGKNKKEIIKEKSIQIYAILINALVRAGKYDEAIRRADEVLSIQRKAKNSKNKDLLIDIATYKAFALKYLGRTKHALTIGLQLKNKKNISLISQYRINNFLGSIYNTLGDYQKAIEYRIQTLRIAEKMGSNSLIASAKGNLGISYINNGEFKKGEEFLLQHREYSIKSGQVREQIMSYLNLGACYLFQGFLDRAIEELQNGINLCNETVNQADLVWLLTYYGIALLFKENFLKAEESFDRGIEIARKLRNRRIQFKTMVYKGLIAYILNRMTDLNDLSQQIDKEFGEKYKNNSLYYILAALNSLNPKKRNELVKKSLELGEKDYSEFIFLLYFCVRFLKNNPDRKTHLQKAKLIATKFNMTGWLERLEPKIEKTEPPLLNIFTLGRLNIQKLESEFSYIKLVNWQKLRDFFTILIISKLEKKALTRDEIGAFLWPELTKKQVINNFHVCLSELKRIFGKDYFLYENGTYSLNNVYIDAIEFLDSITYARNLYSQGKLHPAEEKLKNALSLYKGPFLEDCYGTWVDEPRERINRIYRQALFLLSEIYLKKLRFQETIEILRNVLILDPFDEEAHRTLMRVYLLINEKSRAIEQYNKCFELFKKEYDCLPSEETRQLYEEIKRH